MLLAEPAMNGLSMKRAGDVLTWGRQTDPRGRELSTWEEPRLLHTPAVSELSDRPCGRFTGPVLKEPSFTQEPPSGVVHSYHYSILSC